MRRSNPKAARDKAKAEIFAVLSEDMKISAEHMDSILQKHGVRRDPKELQRAYRLSVGRRFMAGVRDVEGKREILAVRTQNGMEYIVVDACNDADTLKRLQHRLRGCISGLQSTSGKVKARQGFLRSLRKRLFQGR